jgi:hypothetical protein
VKALEGGRSATGEKCTEIAALQQTFNHCAMRFDASLRVLQNRSQVHVDDSNCLKVWMPIVSPDAWVADIPRQVRRGK